MPNECGQPPISRIGSRVRRPSAVCRRLSYLAPDSYPLTPNFPIRVHPRSSVVNSLLLPPWPGTTRTTVDLNHRRIIHKPQPSFLRDLGAWPLHLFP
jgi:hypothetical protein